MRFKVGVIGASGFIGVPYRQEMRDASEQYDIVAVCARRRDLLEAAGREDGAALVTTDWREVVAHPDVDTVVVAVPDVLHYEMALECAAQGKHIVCEKPVAMNAREAHEIWTAYRDRGLGHFVPFWTRGVPAFRRVRQLLAEGLIGEVRAWSIAGTTRGCNRCPTPARRRRAVGRRQRRRRRLPCLRRLALAHGLEARRVFAQAGVLSPAQARPRRAQSRGSARLERSARRDGRGITPGGHGVRLRQSHLRAGQRRGRRAHGFARALFAIGAGAGCRVARLRGLHFPFPLAALPAICASARKPGESELLEALPAPDAPNNFRDMVIPACSRPWAGRPPRCRGWTTVGGCRCSRTPPSHPPSGAPGSRQLSSTPGTRVRSGSRRPVGPSDPSRWRPERLPRCPGRRVR